MNDELGSRPFLSIVIPTREGFSDHWLTALLNVKGQIEFILVHPPGVRPSPVDDPRIKQIVSALRGEIIQRSTGFLNAIGTYVLTINCDEYLHPDVESLVSDYFDRFPDSWVLRLSRQGFPYGERASFDEPWLPFPDVKTLGICSRKQNTSQLFPENTYLLEVPIAPLENPFNPIALIGKRKDHQGPHLENFDKKVWKNELVQPAVTEIMGLMSVGGPIKYIPFWCLDRLLGLYLQAKFFERGKTIGHWMPLVPEQIRIEDNPPQHQRTRRFYFIAEALLLRRFPQYGYLWNLILAQAMEVPSRAFDSLKRKISPPEAVNESGEIGELSTIPRHR
jgi:hypothetical protein